MAESLEETVGANVSSEVLFVLSAEASSKVAPVEAPILNWQFGGGSLAVLGRLGARG